MADKNESVLDKAENLARRILERLGSKVDSKVVAGGQSTLSQREVGEITSRIERVIESSLRNDKDGMKRVAPNRFKVLFTYEETNRLNSQYLEALAKELKGEIFEYITNRRYETRGPVMVETGRDVFAKTTVIRANFEGEQEAPIASAAKTSDSQNTEAAKTRAISLDNSDGRSFRMELKSDGAPSYIGRTAGNAARIDDASISRMHCSIALRSNGDVVIADLGSSNGTYVNDQLLAASEARPLKQGDVIGVGDFKLRVTEIA
ncbi:MAG: FHA domain-containing protein [Blastocatellia bacterium]